MMVDQDWFASWEACGSLKVGDMLGFHGIAANRQPIKYDIWIYLVLFHTGKHMQFQFWWKTDFFGSLFFNFSINSVYICIYIYFLCTPIHFFLDHQNTWPQTISEWPDFVANSSPRCIVNGSIWPPTYVNFDKFSASDITAIKLGIYIYIHRYGFQACLCNQHQEWFQIWVGPEIRFGTCWWFSAEDSQCLPALCHWRFWYPSILRRA